MKAVIQTGGKQYSVSVGDKIDVEKLDAKVGTKVKLNTIAILDGPKVETNPTKAAKTEVEAKVLDQHKDDKKIVFKFKRRKNYKVKNGHRQNLTLIEITKIGNTTATAKKGSAKIAKSTNTRAVDSKTTATKNTSQKANK